MSNRGRNQFNNPWLPLDNEILRASYEEAVSAGDLAGLAARMGRTKAFICRKARDLGLTKRGRPPVAEQRAAASDRMKKWHVENEHPKGFSGHTHDQSSRARMCSASVAMWGKMSDDERAALTTRQLKAKLEKTGTLTNERPNATWKAGWREIGPVRKYYRSRWEANYARYLEWLRLRGEIKAWKHEPTTFWFDAIKRGARSYLPDFHVVGSDGAEAYHEVKGWFDARSKTKIRRMAKYHPTVKLIVVDGKAYRSIEKAVRPFIEGWE